MGAKQVLETKRRRTTVVACGVAGSRDTSLSRLRDTLDSEKNEKVMSMTEHVLQAVKDKVKMQTRISPFVSGSDVGGVGGVET